MTTTVGVRAGLPPGLDTVPLRLALTTSRHRQRRQPVVVMSWRVLLPNGRLLGWVQLTYARVNGRFTWYAAAPFGGWVPITSPGRPRRGRDAVAALLAYHGVQEEVG